MIYLPLCYHFFFCRRLFSFLTIMRNRRSDILSTLTKFFFLYILLITRFYIYFFFICNRAKEISMQISRDNYSLTWKKTKSQLERANYFFFIYFTLLPFFYILYFTTIQYHFLPLHNIHHCCVFIFYSTDKCNTLLSKINALYSNKHSTFLSL